MAQPLPSYLRKRRRMWALTQRELAALLEVSPDAISKYERLARIPSLEVMVGLEVVFDRRSLDLLPALSHAVRRRVTSSTTYLNDPASGAMSEAAISGGATGWKDYIASDNGLVAVRLCTGASPCTTGASFDYVVTDHLGSTSVLTNSSGTVTERDSYDAWGLRRNPNGTDASTCNSIASALTRGFTGQEQIDAACAINFNARIYDPTIARFMSADSMVPDPLNGQSFNRYSYVNNNPAAFIDPTGHAEGQCNIGPGDQCQYVNYDSTQPCWGCSGPGLTSDALGNPVPASNFNGGWNRNSIGWNAPNYNAPTCGGGITSGCWTPTTGGGTILTDANGNPIGADIWSTHSYWVPGPSTYTNGWISYGTGTADTNWGGLGTGALLGTGGAAAVVTGICILVEPCGLAEGGLALAGVGVGGLTSYLAGKYNPASPITNTKAMAATTFFGGLGGGITAPFAISSAGSAVLAGSLTSFGGGVLGQMSGDYLQSGSVNGSAALIAGGANVGGYFLGGSAALDAGFAGTSVNLGALGAAQTTASFGGAFMSYGIQSVSTPKGP